MIIRGVELPDIDLCEYETAEKWEDCMKLLEKIPEKVSGKKNSESIKIQCETVFEIFDTMFGDGTAKKVFGERTNLMISIEAMSELIDAVNNKDRSDNQKIIDLTAKYTPNRAARRNANKSKP